MELMGYCLSYCFVWIQYDFNGSQVPPEWHAWLNHVRKDPPHLDAIVRESEPAWKSQHHENLTGTRESHHPTGTLGRLRAPLILACCCFYRCGLQDLLDDGTQGHRMAAKDCRTTVKDAAISPGPLGHHVTTCSCTLYAAQGGSFVG